MKTAYKIRVMRESPKKSGTHICISLEERSKPESVFLDSLTEFLSKLYLLVYLQLHGWMEDDRNKDFHKRLKTEQTKRRKNPWPDYLKTIGLSTFIQLKCLTDVCFWTALGSTALIADSAGAFTSHQHSKLPTITGKPRLTTCDTMILCKE